MWFNEETRFAVRDIRSNGLDGCSDVSVCCSISRVFARKQEPLRLSFGQPRPLCSPCPHAPRAVHPCLHPPLLPAPDASTTPQQLPFHMARTTRAPVSILLCFPRACTTPKQLQRTVAASGSRCNTRSTFATSR
jgi:hypothetical protein